MRKFIQIAVPVIVIVILILVVSAVTAGCLRTRSPVSPAAEPENAPSRNTLSQDSVTANGIVRSNQSALLNWQAAGTVGEVNAAVGQQVSTGQELASLSQSSLPPEIILARAELVSAQKALDVLETSSLQQAEALKAVEDAQNALEDLRNPQLGQAGALEAVAAAQKAVDGANLQVYILTAPPSQAAIDQAHASMLLAERKLDNTRKTLERLQNQLKKIKMLPPPFRNRFRRALQNGIQNLEFQLNRDQMAYDRQVNQYNELLEPADPIELAVARADLGKAQAQLADAQREWERLENGPTSAEVAIAEARLAEAQRQWERLKEGPNPDDLAAARAKVAAAQAALNQIHIAAPFNGQVTEIGSQPGDQVEPGDQAFRLDDLSRLLVDVQVSEVDINRVEAGQPAVLTFDGIVGKEYHGRVIEAAPVGMEVEGVVNFMAAVELNDADPLVKPGMTAEVEIIIDETNGG